MANKIQKKIGKEEKPEASNELSRRRLLKKIILATGATVATTSLSSQWMKPVVDVVLVPAHAQTSQEPTPEPTPNIVLESFEFTCNEQVTIETLSGPRTGYVGRYVGQLTSDISGTDFTAFAVNFDVTVAMSDQFGGTQSRTFQVTLGADGSFSLPINYGPNNVHPYTEPTIGYSVQITCDITVSDQENNVFLTASRVDTPSSNSDVHRYCLTIYWPIN